MFRFISALLVLSVATNGFAQDQLVWKFRTNEKLNYQVTQQMETVANIGGNETRQTLGQAMNMSWNVLSQSAEGNAVINQVVERIRMEMESGPGAKISYDSNNKEKSDNPGVNAMGAIFQKIVGQDFKISMNGNGKVTSVVIPPELMEAVENSAAGASQALDKDTLKEMMKQSAVTLPDKAVKAGDTWTSTQKVPLPFGEMNISSTMTYVERNENGDAVIDVVPKITVLPAENAAVRVSLNNSSGRGRVTFDIVNGRVLKSELALSMKMDMEIVSQKQKFTQTINQKTVMVLK